MFFLAIAAAVLVFADDTASAVTVWAPIAFGGLFVTLPVMLAAALDPVWIGVPEDAAGVA